MVDGGLIRLLLLKLPSSTETLCTKDMVDHRGCRPGSLHRNTMRLVRRPGGGANAFPPVPSPIVPTIQAQPNRTGPRENGSFPGGPVGPSRRYEAYFHRHPQPVAITSLVRHTSYTFEQGLVLRPGRAGRLSCLRSCEDLFFAGAFLRRAVLFWTSRPIN